MRNGRFNPPKCRGKVQKLRVLYIHSSKIPSPSSNFLITPKKSEKNPKIAKKGRLQGSSLQSVRLRAIAGGRPLITGRSRAPACWSATSGREVVGRAQVP
jgi:hypothetical protein